VPSLWSFKSYNFLSGGYALGGVLFFNSRAVFLRAAALTLLHIWALCAGENWN
jgi:hypothetical protein